MENQAKKLVRKELDPDVDFANIFLKFGTGGADSTKELLAFELLGLQHLEHGCAPANLIKVPKGLMAGELENGTGFIAVERIKFARGKSSAAMQRSLGIGLAEMHNHKSELYDRYGFPLDGCCGALEQPNNAEGRQLDWVSFWKEFRLGSQMEHIKRNFPQDDRLHEKLAELHKRLPELFSMIKVEDISPSILHGDLWAGNCNVCNTEQGLKPCIYDPAAYHGHSEADLGIARMFGGFSSEFFSAYHSKIPKQPGFERRALLYELHHHLNHMNIFGAGYRSGVISLLDKILK